MPATRSEYSTDSRAGKWFLAFIGLCIMLMGVVFCWLLFQSYKNAAATREWTQVDAVVLQSEIEQRQIQGSPMEYRLAILYSYDLGSKSYTSDKMSPRGGKWSRRENEINKLAETYPTGSSHTAWVNPEAHDVAILKHDTKAAGYTLWFPALFVVAGIGMIWGALRTRKSPA